MALKCLKIKSLHCIFKNLDNILKMHHGIYKTKRKEIKISKRKPSIL